MRTLRAVGLLTALVASAAAAGAQPPARPRLVYAGNADFPPYEYVDADGQPAGFNIELIRKVAATAGVDVSFRMGSWGAAPAELEAGRADFAWLARTPAREGRFTFLSASWPVRVVMLYRGVRSPAPRALADLARDTVGVVGGSTIAEELRRLPDGQRPRLVETATHDGLLTLLGRGDLSVVVGNSLALRAARAEFVADDFTEAPLRTVDYRMATLRGREPLVASLVLAFDDFYRTPEYYGLVERYLLASAPRADGFVSRHVGWVLLLVTLLGLVVLAWNAALRRTVHARTRDLQTSEQRYRQLLSSVHVIVWRADLETHRLTFVSNEAEALLGYSVALWLQPGFWIAHVHEDDRERVRAHTLARSGSTDQVLEYRMVAADGRVVWLRDIVQIVQEPGLPPALVGAMVDITEIRRQQEALSFNAQVIAGISEAIVALDASRRVTFWNKGAERLMRMSAADAIGRRVDDLVQWRFANPEAAPERQGLEAEQPWRGEVQLVLHDGHEVSVEVHTHLLLEGTPPRPVGYLSVARDIGDRRRADEAARARARQQAAVAALGQRALAGVDLDLLMQQTAALAAHTLGIDHAGIFELQSTRQELQLRAGFGWTREQGPAPIISALHQVQGGYTLAAAKPVVVEDLATEPRFTPDPWFAAQGLVSGAHVVIEGRLRPYGLFVVFAHRSHLFSRDDLHFLQAIANVLGAAIERKQVEEELRATLSLHRATLESTADGILVVDDTGLVTSYNHKFLELWDLPASVMASRDHKDVLAAMLARAKDAPALVGALDTIDRAPDDETTDVVELKDGRVLERYSLPQRIAGSAVGRVWNFRDLTARVEAETERRRLEAQIQHVQKLESLGVLAGGIAHDFNNLLVGMLGHAGLALMDLPPDAPIAARLRQIETAAMRAAELTNQMLAYSGKGRFVIGPLNLSSLVDEMMHLLQTVITKNARVEAALARDLPAIEADASQIRQVVMNLITNASDAIGEQPGTIGIRTRTVVADRAYLADAYLGAEVPEGTYACVEVRDTGCGMDRETLGRIFDPFFTTKFTGRGLGLAAVLGIVRGHRGTIRISSTPGQGTTFEVLFPVSAAAHAAPPARARAVAPALPRRVLVVDDEDTVRSVSRTILENSGIEVLTASDGVEALELFAREGHSIDVVLLDVTMPRMDGAQALHAIRQIRPDARVVLTSGYSEVEAAERFAGAPPAGFIQKPYRPRALVEKIREAAGTELVDWSNGRTVER